MVLARKNKKEHYIYLDEGVSGSTDVYERPGFAELLEDLNASDEESRPFDVVVVYKIAWVCTSRHQSQILDFKVANGAGSTSRAC